LLLGSQRNALEAEPGAGLAMAVRPGSVEVCDLASGDRWAGAEAQLAKLLKALARRKDPVLSAIVLNEGRLAGWRRYKHDAIPAVARHSADCVVSVSEELQKHLPLPACKQGSHHSQRY
jgi:hypothetical protein